MQFSISYCFLPVALAFDGQLVFFIQPRQNETGLHGQNGEIQEYTERKNTSRAKHILDFF
jgi:hypothetical protein